MSIIATDLTYIHPDREKLFSGASFALAAGEKASLIGDNGSGKSTLLAILAGKLTPAAGNYHIGGTLWTVPQHFGQYDDMTIAEALDIARKMTAMEAISAGDTAEELFSEIGDDWTIGEKARAALDWWGLSHIGIDQRMNTLSGGEKTRVFLSGIEVHAPDTILMDEPTNHLDSSSRRKLYALIARSRATILVVSHDRRLLNLLGTTLELTSVGVRRYGGNYDFYKNESDIQRSALQNRIEDKEKSLRAAEKRARDVIERKQRSDARAPAKQRKEGTLPAAMNKYRGKAELSASRLKDTHAEKIASIESEKRLLKDRLAPAAKMKLAFEDTSLHTGKILAEATAMNFHYPGRKELWKQPVSFILRSGERISVAGDNGAGKTTLIKIILGSEEPTSGRISRGAFSYIWIDQEYSMIDDSLTVIEQLEKYNARNLPDSFLRTELHRFLFPAETWDKPCGRLSGGEKMKLSLCCLEVSDDNPDIFVLDEPTNNLDIRSMETLTRAVSSYRGTVLAISHDETFLADIGVTGTIILHKD